MFDIKIAKSDDEIKNCYPIVVQLRPNYSETEFVQQVHQQKQLNYQLAYLKENNNICAVAGYRFSENLAWGKFLYVDDLITASSQRSKGYGKVLLDWLLNQARESGCKQLHLDSGVQRVDAHRFYSREKMQHTSQHYAVDID